jgi:hypothetical protein
MFSCFPWRCLGFSHLSDIYIVSIMLDSFRLRNQQASLTEPPLLAMMLLADYKHIE